MYLCPTENTDQFCVGFVADCFTAVDGGINDMMFSTKDNRNDISSEDCANKYRAGWWYSNCHCANPNGQYLDGYNTQGGVGITYERWLGQWYALKSTQFMVKQITKPTQTSETKKAALPAYD